MNRFTEKVGPLPVWAWAVILLVGGYLVYKLTNKPGATTAASATPATSDTTNPQTDLSTSGPVGPNQAGATDTTALPGNVSDLSGNVSALAGQVDALTAAILSTPAFQSPNEGGSGSSVPNGSPTPIQITIHETGQQTRPAKPQRKPKAKTPKPPAPRKKTVRK